MPPRAAPSTRTPEPCTGYQEHMPYGTMCMASVFFHTSLDLVLANPVSFGLCLALYLFLGCAGSCFEFTWRHGQTWVNFSRAVVVAGFYYLQPLTDDPTVASYIAIGVCVVVGDFVNSLGSVRAKQKEWTGARLSLFETGKQETPMGTMLAVYKTPGDYVVGNRYMELSYPFSRVCLYFFVQSSLFALYTFHMMGLRDQFNDAQDRKENVDMAFWFFSMCLCNLAGADNLGGRYNAFYWQDISDVADQELFSGKKSHHWFGFMPVIQFFKNEWRLRRFMSFFVNGICRSCILGTAPILMSVADPLSVIKDSMAVFFLTTIDDLPDAKSLIEELFVTYSTANPEDPKSKTLLSQVTANAEKAKKDASQAVESKNDASPTPA
ncbi:unnamed protein product [Prorocentrum cordatum]|nr:unnamed protein product [Polarella glacialis]